MYGHLNMSGAPDVRCYADALKAWETSKPWKYTHRTPEWRRRPDNERPICQSLRRHEHKSIINRGGAIAFRLYDTDVITYYPDDSIEIDPYNSTATDDFAGSFFPDGVRAQMNCGAIVVGGWQTGRYYRAYKPMHLKRTDGEYPWEVIDPQPWEKKVIDRAELRSFCARWGYNTFRDAAPGFFALHGIMGARFDMPRTGRGESVEEIVQAGPSDAWMAFVSNRTPPDWWCGHRLPFNSDPPFLLSTVMTKLRYASCERAKAYSIEKMPYVVGYQAWQAMRSPKF